MMLASYTRLRGMWMWYFGRRYFVLLTAANLESEGTDEMLVADTDSASWAGVHKSKCKTGGGIISRHTERLRYEKLERMRISTGKG
jgi:hypothetical protein